MSRVAVIGIDGLDYNLVKKWAIDLPTLRSLGIRRLESVIPTLSCPSWPCMYTGLSPEELNIYDFVDINSGHLITSSRWWDQSIFSMLEGLGKRQILSNIPFSYPYPSRAASTTLTMGMGSPSFPLINISIPDKEGDMEGRLRDLLHNELRSALKLLDSNKRWDLFFHIFYTTDPIQHYFWKHHDHTHPKYKEGSYKESIHTTYRIIDNYLERLIRELPDCKILVVSDHGFGPYTRGFNVNRWLEKEGYLVHNKSQGTPVASRIRSIGESIAPQFVLNKIPKRLVSPFSTGKDISNMTSRLYTTMDLSQTSAYSPGTSSGLIITHDPFIEREIIDKLSIMGIEAVSNYRGMLFIIGNRTYPMNSWKKEIWLDHTWSGSHTLNGIVGGNFKIPEAVKEVPDIAFLIKGLILE